MSFNKVLMSTSYKVVFVLSIVMIFVVIIGGIISGYKSFGFGIFYWTYIVLLMYKRDILGLISFQKIILWIQGIAFFIALAVLLLSDTDASRFVDINPLDLLFVAIFSSGITYFLYKFFLTQIRTNAEINVSNVESSLKDSALWEQVSEELKSGKKIDSLWTRAFSDADGDGSKANARYIKLRIHQLSESHHSNISDSRDRLVPRDIVRSSNGKHSIIIGIFLSLLVVSVLIFYKSKFSFLMENSPVISYLGITLNSSMDEIKYSFGVPSEVFYKDNVPFTLADGTILTDSLTLATKEDILANKGVNNFFFWQYNYPEYRVDISFDTNLRKVNSIGCYVSNSSKNVPKECDILNVKINDDENKILEKLGQPQKEEINHVTKTLYYSHLNLKLFFEKRHLYYIVIGNSNNTLSSSVFTKPSYDDVGWTQESTGSKEIGPWLKYSPPSTRYCRYSDGTIQRLYPPGIKPNAEKANPFCLGNSTSSP